MRSLRVVAKLLGWLVFPGMLLGQQTTPGVQQVQAELLDTVKAKKAKVGDIVRARTLSALVLAKGLVVPIGSKLMGQVRSIEADSLQGHTSTIAISFDEVELKKGQKLPLKLSVRAALMPSAEGRAPAEEPAHKMNDPSVGMDRPLSGGRYSLSETSTASVYTPEGKQPQDAAGQEGVMVRPGTVAGMPGVELELDSGPPYASKFKSAHKNLELQQGLLLGLSVVQ